MLAWVRGFRPAPLAIGRVERLRMSIGAFIGIGLTSLLCHVLDVPRGLSWIVAPMGASAVLVFGLPGSPLSQPWSVVVGHAVAALVGVGCVQLRLPVDLGGACAVALAIAAMLALRCLHPPAGGTALLMVLAGTTDAAAVVAPVLANALLLTAAGLAYNNATRRTYPHRAPAAPPGPVTEEDLDAVLGQYKELLDIGRDDLRTLLDRTQRLAHQRRLADTRCADVMVRDVVTVEYGTELQDAWALLRQKHLKVLPVVDRGRHVVGIVTLTDFLSAAQLDLHEGFDQRLRQLILPSPATHSAKPEVVGQIMTRRVRVTREHRTLSDLLLLFDSTGHRHIPVVGETGKLVGMVTQSDVVAALKVSEGVDLGRDPDPSAPAPQASKP
jgi:CBS domain-containing membrane protein